MGKKKDQRVAFVRPVLRDKPQTPDLQALGALGLMLIAVVRQHAERYGREETLRVLGLAAESLASFEE